MLLEIALNCEKQHAAAVGSASALGEGGMFMGAAEVFLIDFEGRRQTGWTWSQ